VLRKKRVERLAGIRAADLPEVQDLQRRFTSLMPGS
jgi:hypothetical protein